MTALLEVERLHRRFAIGAVPGALARALGRGKPPSLLHAVDDVSFSLAKGETIGLVGESGCGKSTLARLLARLLDPTEGSIRFAGEEIGAIPAKGFGASRWRSRIQMVFQDAQDSINPRFTAFAAIADPLRRLRQLSGKALADRVGTLADQTGLPRDLLGRFPHQLSGGQKARVGIARAIAVEPELLILDEPTAALDVSVQSVILHLLDDLRRQLGMSYVFVSHDLNVVRLLCNRVVVMYLGRIVEQGPADEVFANPAHPYTKALIAAIPEPDRQGPGIRLTGEPRSPIDPSPSVCRFFGRCPKGNDRCTQAMPALAEIEPSRQVACHFPERIAA
jgi:oligopeptide/dipeptide ABC transporter ATP-binding protein